MATEERRGLIAQRVNSRTSLDPVAQPVDQEVIADVTHRRRRVGELAHCFRAESSGC